MTCLPLSVDRFIHRCDQWLILIEVNLALTIGFYAQDAGPLRYWKYPVREEGENEDLRHHPNS